MITKPRLEYRREQPFVAIRQNVSIPFGHLLSPLWDEVHAWLDAMEVLPSGPPIIRYLTTDMANGLDIEVGFLLDRPILGTDRFSADVFPAGHYAALVYSGPYDNDGLVGATGALLDWARQNHIAWQTTMVEHVEWWKARSEIYLTDPALEPDPQKWQTELVFLTRET